MTKLQGECRNSRPSHWVQIRALALVAFGVCCFVFSATAQEPICKDTTAEAPIPVSLTLSGGVSLGAYQAGFVYYMQLVFKDNPGLFEPKLITGSSAGGLNTLLSILSFCGKDEGSPLESPLGKAWLTLEATDLVGPLEDPRSIVPRTGFVKISEEIGKVWEKGLPETCDLVVGVSAARLTPKKVRPYSTLGFERQEEKFALRIRGRGEGRAPQITNYVNALAEGGQPILALTPDDDRQNFDALRDLMFATSAFPPVWAPQKLRYCTIDPKDSRWLHAKYPLTCAPAEIEEAEFLDGGLLDNKPLGLAERLTRTGLDSMSCEKPRWREIPLAPSQPSSLSPSALFLYSDIHFTGYPKPSEGDEKQLLPYLSSFLASLFDTTRTQEALSSFEQNPRFVNQVAAAKSLYPRASDHLFGFFGFFERDLRAYDFYLGMFEAREFFRKRVRTSLFRGSENVARGLKLPEEKRANEKTWMPLNCLIGKFDPTRPELLAACPLSSNSNFETLADVSQQRLARFCAMANPEERKNWESCSRVEVPNEVASADLNDFGFSLRLLSEKRFEFRDLGLGRGETAQAAAKIKSGALEAIGRTADAQPGFSSVIVKSVGPVVLNSIERLPTERELAILLGPAVDIVASILQPGSVYPPRWRLIASLQLQNPSAWLGSGGRAIAPAGLFGFEYESSRLSSQALQARLGLQIGYQFNAGGGPFDRGGIWNACNGDSTAIADCRGFVLQPGISVAFYERIRLQLSAQFLPFVSGALPWQILPAAGLQFYF